MNGTISSDIPHTCRRIKITDLNPHLMCVLCGGYYIDATTIIECLHSFCKTCIVRYLDTSKFCPICDVQVHKTKPLLNIRSDQTLQDIVYKLVPGLFQCEMKRRRDFYASHPQEDKNSNPRSNEERGEVESDFPRNFFQPDEFISIALEYSESGGISNSPDRNEHNEKSQNVGRRYLRCPVFITVAHLKKLIRAKYSLSTEHRIDILFSQDNLNDDYMLMDIAYMYAWKRKGPLKLFFRIFERPAKRMKTFHCRAPLFGLEKFRHSVLSHPSSIAKKASSPAPEVSAAKPSSKKSDPGVEPAAKDETAENPAAEKPKEASGERASPKPELALVRSATCMGPKTPAPEGEKIPNKVAKNGLCQNNNSATENNKNKNVNNNEEAKTDENLKLKEKPKPKCETSQNLTNGIGAHSAGPKGEASLPEKVNGLLPAASGKDRAVKLLQVEAK